MKTLLMVIAILSLSGCTTNGTFDAGKTWLLVGAVVVGGVIASQGGGDSEKTGDCYILVTPTGSNRVCN